MFKTIPIFLSFGIAVFSVVSHARMDQTAPVRFGSKIITTGMTESAVVAIAGSPTQSISLVNDYGAPVGRKLVYRIGGYNKRTVIVVFQGGEVTRLNECIGVVADRCD